MLADSRVAELATFVIASDGATTAGSFDKL